MLEIHKNNLR